MKKILTLLALSALCACSPPDGGDMKPSVAPTGAADIYDGRVYGIYKPLEVIEEAGRITVNGETFTWSFDRGSGQVVSARALGDEFLAPGASFPNPYIGVMPENDPGANRTGPAESRPRYGFEKAVAMRPTLFSGGLTSAHRFESSRSGGVSTSLVSSAPDMVRIASGGEYLDESGRPTGLRWGTDYRIDVDGFMKVTVRLTADNPVKLRWHCYNHTFFDREKARFLARDHDPGAPPFNIRQADTTPLDDLVDGAAVLESHWNPLFHLGNPLTGIEFTKEEFSGRLSGYRDSGVLLPDGRRVATGSVETEDGQVLNNWDSRGRQDIFTQIYNRPRGLELEEFDIRNTTCPLNPGEVRERVFYVQLTPPKLPREDLASARVVWPGPHQIRMAGWKGDPEPWEPPSDEQLKQWAQAGVNLIIGGANYFSGDYARPTQPDKIRRFIETAHSYGMRVIPYVTTSDWDFEAPGYQERAADWMCSKAIEFITETSLMCFGAEGWRDHVEAQCDTLLMNFPFDGLYVDNWFITRHCNNARHGCDGYLGRYVTDGYHDFAKRLRRVVARHTDGRGIMLFNTDNVLCSTSLSWFDLRLSGENNDPLRMPGETVLSTWNGKRQGVQSVVMWRENQDALDMLNFCARFGFSFRLRRTGGRVDPLSGWKSAAHNTETGFNRLYWDIQRFFDVNGAVSFSAFDSREVLSLGQPGSTVTACARDGKVLLSVGFQETRESATGDRTGRTVRRETLSIHRPEKLGLDPSGSYRIVDLAGGRYLDGRVYGTGDLRDVPLSLTLGETRFLLIEPVVEAPRLVYFLGADGAAVERSASGLNVSLNAVEGSPVKLFIDTGGVSFRSVTPGFAAGKPDGGFLVFEGDLPSDGRIELIRE